MLLEILVVTTCLQQKGGCSESTGAYYKSNKEIQAIVESAESFGKKIVNNNQWVVYAATPTYAIVSGNTAYVHVYKTWVLGINMKREIVSLQWSY